MDLQAVIFDMDGVLCATDEYHYESWQRVSQEFGLHFTRMDNDRLLGLTRRASLEALLDGRRLPEELMKEILDRKNQYFLESIQSITRLNRNPGVTELLEELDRSGIKTGVASASRNVRSVLERLELLSSFHAICDSNSIHRSKPAPDVFLTAASELETPPAACLVIEDSPAGVQAGQAAGMCVIGLGPAERVGHAFVVFPNLEGIRVQRLRFIHAKWSAHNSASGHFEDFAEPGSLPEAG